MKNLFFILFILCLSFFAEAQKSNSIKAISDTSLIVDPIEPSPHFPGGQKAWNKFLAKNLKWPKTNMDVQGTVFINFVVEKNGKLSNIRIAHGLAHEFDVEALRVLRLSPHWLPAKLKGKSYRCRYTVPVRFRING